MPFKIKFTKPMFFSTLYEMRKGAGEWEKLEGGI